MNNKKGIMFFASLLILIFHLWIYISTRTSSFYQYEIFLRSICYIGVDIFFFLSSYSIANQKTVNYSLFIRNRFKNVYSKFIFFSIIAFIIKKWSIKKLIFTILGINLFIKGGGSFLWFIPALMIVYLLLPLYKKLEDKHKVLCPITLTMIYILIAILVTNLTNYTAIFIFLNRIPIIMIGYYISKYKLFDKIKNNIGLIIAFIAFLLGIIILYITRHNRFTYIYDFKYILAIPLVISTIYLLSRIKTNKIIDKLGSITLEIYAYQMIFGFSLAEKIFKLVHIKLLSNVTTITIIILFALLTNNIIDLIKRLINKKKITINN